MVEAKVVVMVVFVAGLMVVVLVGLVMAGLLVGVIV